MRKSQNQPQLLFTMPALEDAEPLEGAAAPDTGTYESAGNKFTRLHSPRMDEDDSDEPPSSSQEAPDCSQQDNKKQTEEDNPPTPDFCPGTPDVIIAQLDQEQYEVEEVPAQQEVTSTTNPVKMKPNDTLVDPLQVLLTSVPITLGSATVTKEEDQLLGVGDVTTPMSQLGHPLTKSRIPPVMLYQMKKDDVSAHICWCGGQHGRHLICR